MATRIPSALQSPRESEPPPDLHLPSEALTLALARNVAPRLAPVLDARGVGPYRGYSELLEHIQRLGRAGFRLETIGRSVEGEPLFALHIGKEPRGTLVRSAVILSAVHPMEWIGIEAHFRLLDRLASEELGDRAIISIPIVNPDGLKRVEKSLRAGRKRFIRHNARGVDLNRNFDARWGKLGLVQRMLASIFHPGSGPSSEPEVLAVAHHLSQCRVDRAVSLHSFGGAVLYPSASSSLPVHDEREHQAWAERLARVIDPSKPYAANSCARWAKGITAGGLELDWFHSRHGAVSLLIECSRGGRSLHPSKLLLPFAWFNPKRLAAEAQSIAEALVPFAKGLEV